MEYDNPAARLLSLLKKCQQYRGSTPCRQAWKEILKTGDDGALLMARLGKAMELPQVTIDALRESFPNRETMWHHWNSQVSSAFLNQNLGANWDTFINYIDQHTLNYLQMSSDLLEGKSTTKILEQSNLDEIRREFAQLHEEVINSSMNPEVKKYLIRSLRRIIVSVDEYRLTGALPLLEAVEAMVGHAQMDPAYKNFMQTSDLGRKIVDSLGAMANAVTVVVGIPQLAQTIQLIAN